MGRASFETLPIHNFLCPIQWLLNSQYCCLIDGLLRISAPIMKRDAIRILCHLDKLGSATHRRLSSGFTALKSLPYLLLRLGHQEPPTPVAYRQLS